MPKATSRHESCLGKCLWLTAEAIRATVIFELIHPEDVEKPALAFKSGGREFGFAF
jgi:hypothetical protein